MKGEIGAIIIAIKVEFECGFLSFDIKRVVIYESFGNI
jgi:hypothetical protein